MRKDLATGKGMAANNEDAVMVDNIMDETVRGSDEAWTETLDRLSLQPLWESKLSLHTDHLAPSDGNLWAWSQMRPIMETAGQLTSPEVIQRRVMLMLDPHSHYPQGEATVGTITACFQLLKPGEAARAHRHSMHAIRFVVEATGGAKTIVDGKSLAMEQGDLILTPGWCWHQHVHDGTDPVIWLDVLDITLHRFLRTEAFEPGPVSNLPSQYPDTMFAAPNILPVEAPWSREYAPVFRYPWADAVKALHAAPADEHGGRSVRYANPLSGSAALPFMDMTLHLVPAGTTHQAPAATFDRVICPVRGDGSIKIGDTTRDWTVNDVVSIPRERAMTLSASAGEDAIYFCVSNMPLFTKLGLAE